MAGGVVVHGGHSGEDWDEEEVRGESGWMRSMSAGSRSKERVEQRRVIEADSPIRDQPEVLGKDGQGYREDAEERTKTKNASSSQFPGCFTTNAFERFLIQAVNRVSLTLLRWLSTSVDELCSFLDEPLRHLDEFFDLVVGHLVSIETSWVAD